MKGYFSWGITQNIYRSLPDFCSKQLASLLCFCIAYMPYSSRLCWCPLSVQYKTVQKPPRHQKKMFLMSASMQSFTKRSLQVYVMYSTTWDRKVILFKLTKNNTSPPPARLLHRPFNVIHPRKCTVMDASWTNDLCGMLKVLIIVLIGYSQCQMMILDES